jgi:hypothetical protein
MTTSELAEMVRDIHNLSMALDSIDEDQSEQFHEMDEDRQAEFAGTVKGILEDMLSTLEALR